VSELKTTEFVFIRLDELNDMRADLRALEALRARWDAIPWGIIEDAILAAQVAGMKFVAETLAAWLSANAPKEVAHD